MVTFAEIYARASARKGGEAALEEGMAKPKSAAALAKISDDRYLAEMTRCVFQAGFAWKVIEAKWDGFEAAFDGFDPGRCALLSDDDLDRLAKDTRIVRNPQKIATVRHNASFLRNLASEHGSAAKAFANWPSSDYVGLLDLMKRKGSRHGGNTAQMFLRRMGKDSFILSRDVTAALIDAGVVDKAPTSKGAMKKVQAAFDAWGEESGRSLTEMSRVLAQSIDV